MSTASVRWPRLAGLLMLVCSAGFAQAATPREVADYAIQQALGGNAEGVTVWLTPEPLDTTHVARFFTNEQIVDEPFPFQQTWLVLIDLFPAQNFGHACLWMFVEDFDGEGPRDVTPPQPTDLPPVVLANNGQGPRIEFRCRRLTNTPCPRLAGDEPPPPGVAGTNGGLAATVGAPDALRRMGDGAPAPRLRDDNPCLHAVLISGGINTDSNYARYPQNIASMYNKLRNCGFPADQIWVYYADGGAIPGVTITGAADKALIRARVQALSPNLDPFNDVLFIYGSNHGADNAGLCLWDMNGDGLGWDEIYTPAELAADTRNSTACRLYVLMDQCFAGEFLDMTTDGEHNRTAVYGAATADEVSWGREYLDRWEDQNISALTMNQLHQDVVDNGNLSSTPVMAEGSPGVGDRKLCECCAFEPPDCDAGGPYTLQCGFDDRGSVQLDGSDSFDPDGQIVRYEWTTDCPGGQFSDPTAVRPTLTFGGACGQTCTVTLAVTDNDGFTSTCTATVNVIDTEPPQISCPPDVTIECDEPNDPSHTGIPTASDTCDPNPQIDISESSIVLGPCGGTYVITRTWRARDACGNEARCDQVITAVDTTPPTIDCTLPAETEVDAACSATIPFSATITDNCCLLLGDAGAGVGAIGVNVSVAGASFDPPQYVVTPVNNKSATVTGTVRVYNLTVCPAVVTLTVTAEDCCENEAIACTRTGNVVDRIPPQITCPPDAYFDKGSYLCEPAILDWLNSATATDNCDPAPIIGSTAPACGFPAGTTTTVTWTAFDFCGNTASCSANITIAPPDRGQPGQKGSLLYFPDVEIKWNAAGQVTQDTFLQISNDFNADVRVQLYFVNGDKPLAASGGERPHPGCNWVDNVIVLTHNEPAYWSVRSGLPKGVAPFIGLDPGTPPGRPDPEGPAGARVLRGYVVGWAVNSAGREIRWNHLTGVATLVDYARGAAWEYGAWAFAASCVANGEEPQDCTVVDAHGVCCDAQVIPGQIDFDNFQYDVGPNRLLLDFFATGATAFSRAGGPTITHNTDLTLALLAQDLRQDHAPPLKTKVQAEIWNANETSFSGVTRCLECWDQSLLSAYGSHFLRSNLQTDNGRARLDGVGSTQCPDSVYVPLLGVANKILTFSTGPVELSGEPLHMSGYEPAQLLYDVPSAPEEKDAGPK